MVIDKHGWVTQSMIPYVEFDGLVFHGIPKAQYPQVFDAIVSDIDHRFCGNRPYYQHKHYQYKPTDVVVEVGAYLGFYTMSVAPVVDRVVAVEMIPELYNIMDMNLEPYPNVTTVMKGVTNCKRDGMASKGNGQTSSIRDDVTEQYSPNCEKVNVEFDTLDNILDENNIDEVDMLIVQVNGHEKEVLEGLTLSRVKNFAIAIPYSEGVVELLDGFETMVDNNTVVYGRALPKQ